MSDSALRKLQLVGQLLKTVITRVNRRGLEKERQQLGLTKDRILGVQFTDNDIRDAEKKSILPKKTYLFYLGPQGVIQRVTVPNIQPDVLIFTTVSTFIMVSTAKMTLQEAYRLRLIQIRYMKNVADQEKDFLHDAGLAIKFFNIIQNELTGDDVVDQ